MRACFQCCAFLLLPLMLSAPEKTLHNNKSAAICLSVYSNAIVFLV